MKTASPGHEAESYCRSFSFFFSIGEEELCEAFGPPLRNVSYCTGAGAAKHLVQHPAAGEPGQSFEDLWGFRCEERGS